MDPSPSEGNEPIPWVTAFTDAAGLAAAVTDSTPLGIASAGVSMENDPSATNVTTNLVGLIPGFDLPMGMTGGFNDLFDYGINHSAPITGATYGGPILDGVPAGYGNDGGLPSGTQGGTSMTQFGCEVSGDC
jgi:hypothetical protein